MNVEQKARELLADELSHDGVNVPMDKLVAIRIEPALRAIARALEQQPEGREAVAAGEPSAAAMAQAFIERYESRYTPHTVELVMAEVRARARELDTAPPAKVPEGMVMMHKEEVQLLIREMEAPGCWPFSIANKLRFLLAAAQQPKEGV